MISHNFSTLKFSKQCCGGEEKGFDPVFLNELRWSEQRSTKVADIVNLAQRGKLYTRTDNPLQHKEFNILNSQSVLNNKLEKEDQSSSDQNPGSHLGNEDLFEIQEV